MSAEMLSSSERAGGPGLRARLQDLEGRLRYQPWAIRLSTLDRRVQVGLMLLPPVLLVLLCLAIGLSVGGAACRGGQYVGRAAVTERGLACVAWHRLNRSLHSVTPDRFPEAGLGSHAFCRNPDSSLRPWCYTSLTANTFDYCLAPPCGPPPPAPPAARPPGSDRSCDSGVTVLHPGKPRTGGVYMVTGQWANGRGVWRQAGPRGPGGGVCLSWHGLYRHWWIGPCSHSGQNAGYAWLEEDGRCPYDGKVWREGGSDVDQEGMVVARAGCMEYGVAGNGEPMDDRMWHEGGLYTPRSSTAGECQELCQESLGCAAFTWYPGQNCSLHSTRTVGPGPRVEGAVSGPASCRVKRRAGCPSGADRLQSGACVLFMDSCPEGCSRWRAMEVCEESGGSLVDSLGLRDLLDLLELANRQHNASTWWTGAADFPKVPGKFSWEAGGAALPDTDQLWVNATARDPMLQLTGSEGHGCVLINHNQGPEGGMRLDNAPCQAELARPLCQYITG